MKKFELKDKLKIGFSFKAKNNSCWTEICTEDNFIVCAIHENKEGVIDTNYCGFQDLRLEDKKELLKIITEYSLTPIEERKRYFVYRLKYVSDQDCYHYYLRYEECIDVFSLENIGFPPLTVFEENDPRLNKVSLEMFEPIEVDKGGNKINE